MAPPSRPPPPLMGDLVEEILIRFPPADPASLARAALVCKLWLHIVSGEGFRRRFREFHRRAPVLGLLCNFRREHHYDEEEVDVVRFVSTASFPRGRALYYRRAIDARHGRVLLRDVLLNGEFAVWDPMTGKERLLPASPRYPFPGSWNAAVLCAAHPTGGCDHLDCRSGPFLVVVVGTDATGMFVHIYSSETGFWTEQAVPHQKKHASWLWPSVLAGDSLYFMLRPRRSVLKYNLGTLEVSVIDLPPISYEPGVLTTTEDGRLGFAAVCASRLYLFTREAGSGGDVGWAQSRVVKLNKLLPADALPTIRYAVGFADGVGIVFVGTKLGVFSIGLKSQRATNVYEGNCCNVLPYMSFCTPAVGATYRGEEPTVGASSA